MLGKTVALQIKTPEGVTFEIPLASPVSRCLALAIDLVVISFLTGVVAYIVSLLAAAGMAIPAIADFGNAALMVASFVISMGYGMFMEWFWRGQTIGKRVLKLQVMDERGLNLSMKQIILRNIFRAVDTLPTNLYFIGGLSCLLTKRCQRLGDIAAGTVVVRKIKVEQPATDQIFTADENSFAEVPHLEARLRQEVTPNEARVALDMITRREEIEPQYRLGIFTQLADHFRTKCEFPENVSFGLSDEQYVRNVVETLYRRTSV